MASYMHGAVTTDDYLVLIGGIGTSGSSVIQLYVFMYSCGQWTDVAAMMTGKFSVVSTPCSAPGLCLSSHSSACGHVAWETLSSLLLLVVINMGVC